MSLRPVFDRYSEWKRDLFARCEPLLAQMRQELCGLQNRPEADEEIAATEELVRAKLEPVLLEAERSLRAVQRAAEQYFEQTEEPSDQDQSFNEEIGQGTERVRDRLERRIASLVAQARAQELLPQQAHPPATASSAATPAAAPGPAVVPSGGTGDAPPQGMRRFCVSCGGKLGPADWSARQCPACQTPL